MSCADDLERLYDKLLTNAILSFINFSKVYIVTDNAAKEPTNS